jgi:predicted nucleotidyltransferase
MDKNEAVKISQRYMRNVSRRYPVQSVILFGSFAKGTQHSDSDIDLAIVSDSLEDIF